MPAQDGQADENESSSRWAAFRLFRGRYAATHLIVLTGLLVAWCGVAYALFESGLITTSPTASGPTAEAARQRVGGLSGFVVGALLGIATLRSLGGPFLNCILAVLYPFIGPPFLFPIAYGTLPAVYGPASNRFDVAAALIVGIPGIVGFFLSGAFYARFVWTAADQERWLESIPDNPVITPLDRE